MEHVNDLTTQFDRALERAQSGEPPPEGAIDAAVEVHECLVMAWASVRTVFGEAATPEHAIAWMNAALSRYRSQTWQRQTTRTE